MEHHHESQQHHDAALLAAQAALQRCHHGDGLAPAEAAKAVATAYVEAMSILKAGPEPTVGPA